MSEPEAQDTDRVQYTFNMALAAVAGQVGCLTLAIIIVTLFGGLWLDSQFGTKPVFTVLLLVGSIPVVIILMFWVVRTATSKIKPSVKETKEIQEDAESG
jgi:F0F1-type ATP synthase assembly protein I